METLHSLLIADHGPDNLPPADKHGGELALIYNDQVTGKIINGLVNTIAASGISGQHQTCSAVLIMLARSLPHLDHTDQQVVIDRLQRVFPTMTQHLFTHEIENGFDLLRQSMHEVDQDPGAEDRAHPHR